MNLQERIENDLKDAISKRDDRIEILKVIVAELQREKTKSLSDDKVIAILKRLKKQEEEAMSLAGDGTSYFWTIVAAYLPAETDRNMIIYWMRENIDFDGLRNKLAAIGIVKKQFPGVDGSIVKEILQTEEF